MKKNPLENPFVWLWVFVITLFLLWLASKALWLATPLILAGLFYYLVTPLVDHIENKGLSHETAVWVALIGLGAFFAVIIPLTAPSMSDQARSLREEAPRYVEAGSQMVVRLFGSLENKFPLVHHLELKKQWEGLLNEIDSNFAKKYLPTFLIQGIGWILPLFLVPFLAFFFLKDGDHFKKLLLQAVPNAYFEKTLLLLYRMDRQIKQYFQGMFWWTVAVSLLLGVGLAIIGVPNPFFLAFLSSVLGWVPYVGAVMGCLIIMLVTGANMPMEPHAPYWVLGLFVFVRIIDDFIIIPFTLGRSLRVHPLLTVLVIFVAGELSGVVGMLLAMPVLGLVMAVTEVATEVLTDDRLRLRHAQVKKRRRELIAESLER